MRRCSLDFQRIILQVFRKCSSQLEILFHAKRMKWTRGSFLVLISYRSHIKLKKCPLQLVHWLQCIVFLLPWAPRDVCGRVQLYSNISPKGEWYPPAAFPLTSYISPLGVISLQFVWRANFFPYRMLPLKIKVLKLDVFLYDFAGLTTWVKLACWSLPNNAIFLLSETYWFTQFYFFLIVVKHI